MEYLETYATNVGKPVYSTGEKWMLNFEKFQVMDTSNLKVPIFGKKVYLRVTLTNTRILITFPEKNLYKMIPFGSIKIDQCEIIKGGVFSKSKIFLKLSDRNLYFLFAKKDHLNQFFNKLKDLIKNPVVIRSEPDGPVDPSSPLPNQLASPGRKLKEEEEEEVFEKVYDKKFVFDLSPYTEIFNKDEKTAKREAYTASPETIRRNLNVLLGPSNKWCSNSPEVIKFRSSMKKLRVLNDARMEQIPFEESPLPLFLSNEPEPKDSSHIFFLCGVHIGTCEQFHKPIFQSCQCDVQTDADSFLTEIIRKANNIKIKDSPEIEQKDYVLKVTGANEYIYGKNELFKFEAIRRALKYGKPYIELNLLQKETEMAKIDHEMGRLKHLEYFPQKAHDNIKLEHKDTMNELSSEINKVNLHHMKGISIRDIDAPFQVKLREFVCVFGPDKLNKQSVFKKKNLDFKDCTLFMHAKLVFGHFLLAEGFSRATTVCNITVFDEVIELFSVLPTERKSQFWPDSEASLGGERLVLVHPSTHRMGQGAGEASLRRNTLAYGSSSSNTVLAGDRQRVPGEKFLIRDLPRESVLLITMYARKYDTKDPMLSSVDYMEEFGVDPKKAPNKEIFKKGLGELREQDVPVGSYSLPMIRFDGKMETGVQTYMLNEGNKANLWSFGEGSGLFSLSFELPEFAVEVYYPNLGYEATESESQRIKDWETAMSYKFGKIGERKVSSIVEEMGNMTPMEELTDRQKWCLWQGRHNLMTFPTMLFPFLRAIPYHIPLAVTEAKKCLDEWKELDNPLDSLELLDFKYADTGVRKYAVSQLEKLPDHELRHYILQLVQALKFELYHDSPLARFLLQRALGDEDIGQNLFWYLKSEMHIPAIRERFGLINEEFLKNCGGFRVELLKQACVVEQLLKMSKEIIELSHSSKKDELNNEIKRMLTQAKFPPIKFKLPLSSKVEICAPVIPKCRVMGSAKKPLFLFFKNADPYSKDSYGIMFKVGDDLRQDLLTLQMLRIMDLLWKQNGLDFHIRPYGCITTGDQEGMIEIVQRSDTIANIMCHFGNKLKTQLLPDRFVKWLEKHNPKSEHNEMRENFKKSCAGYCIASLALGLGDRHADNIMLSKNGDLFHIDFGHFLGHKKNFLGWNRETTPFVFTYQYAKVFENVRSEKFLEFEKLCVRAFTLIRENAKLLMVLLMLMLGCGIPELQSEKEIEWIPDILELKSKLQPDQIQMKVKELIMESVKNKRQIMSDTVHNLKHKGMKGALSVTSIMSGLNFDKHINSVL